MPLDRKWPSVAGSMALLQQHFENLNGEDNFMRAATAKALVIHTADKTGTGPGPDYEFGWGLMNTKNAALKISENDTVAVILDETLAEGETFSFGFTTVDTSIVKVTLVWTDPPGTVLEPALDPEDPALVNDLDLSIENPATGIVYYPWKLDKDNPSNPATNSSENSVDNVEVVFIAVADSGTSYRVTVNHKGTLQSGSQDFSVVSTFTGLSGPVFEVPETDFSADNLTPIISDTIAFTDLSINSPKTWNWSVSPNFVTFVNGSDTTSQNPDIRFDSTGTFTLSLLATNELGYGIETKLDYITVYGILSTTATALPDEICFGDSSRLSVTVHGGSGDFDYSWISEPPGFESNLPNVTVSPETTTTYFIEVTDGIQEVTDSVLVLVNALPEITLGNWPEELCNKDEPPVQLDASPEGGFFSGEAISPEGIFNPESAPIGWNIITYTFKDENNCTNSATDSIYVDECVGLGELQENEKSIKIYPIPNSGNFTVECTETIDRVDIINQFGVVVYSAKAAAKKVEINNSLSKGIYLIKVSFNVPNKKQNIYKTVAVW